MKKVLLILGVWLIGINSAVAEIYHGIDIDEVFATSDWNSKDEIKDIIDDYTLILKYNKDLTECRNAYKIDCLNELTKKIMAHFYSFNYETNLKNYNNYVKATFAAYGTVYCFDKYDIPSGTMCNQENEGKSIEVIIEYVNNLISRVNTKILNYYGFIAKYE